MLLPLWLFVSGLGLVVASVATGEAELSLLVVFPVVSGSGALFLLGAVLIVASFLIGFLWLATGYMPAPRYDDGTAAPGESVGGGAKYGGVVLIGPVPIVFGSTRSMALAILAVGIVTAVVLLGLVFLLG
jgi:uncharacterized protein (TIGR00304 family)